MPVHRPGSMFRGTTECLGLVEGSPVPWRRHRLRGVRLRPMRARAARAAAHCGQSQNKTYALELTLSSFAPGTPKFGGQHGPRNRATLGPCSPQLWRFPSQHYPVDVFQCDYRAARAARCPRTCVLRAPCPATPATSARSMARRARRSSADARPPQRPAGRRPPGERRRRRRSPRSRPRAPGGETMPRSAQRLRSTPDGDPPHADDRSRRLSGVRLALGCGGPMVGGGPMRCGGPMDGGDSTEPRGCSGGLAART